VRKYLIAGNWKMHGSESEACKLLTQIKDGVSQNLKENAKENLSNVEIVVCPPFVYLPLAKHILAGSPVIVGAQNLYLGTQGAYTGEISGRMLADIGCQYVLVGHSERRSLFHEDLNIVSQKCQAALTSQLSPILCVGETKEEREGGKTEEVIYEQINVVIEALGIQAFQDIVIAYEPVWAIGTGLTATPGEAQAVHAFIRHLIGKNNVDIAQTIRILYGGSMKADNAASLLREPDIDGGLIGGASLNADSFLAICTSAVASTTIESR
jgi:triosephosphate isomerase